MSVSAGLYIRLENKEFQPIILIKALIAAGWTLNDHCAIHILPLGDEDFEWTSYQLREEKNVWQALEQKQISFEKIGITLLFGDSCIGGEFLFDFDGLLTFNATINRKIYGEWSDVNWYLQKIISPLSNTIVVSSWEWVEA